MVASADLWRVAAVSLFVVLAYVAVVMGLMCYFEYPDRLPADSRLTREIDGALLRGLGGVLFGCGLVVFGLVAEYGFPRTPAGVSAGFLAFSVVLTIGVVAVEVIGVLL